MIRTRPIILIAVLAGASTIAGCTSDQTQPSVPPPGECRPACADGESADVGITTQAQLDALDSLTFNFKRDDGVAIYLNGVEMVRDNLPAGSDFDDFAAPDTQGGADETAVNTEVVTNALAKRIKFEKPELEVNIVNSQ